MKPLKSFTDLLSWQQGHQLVIDIYRTTQSFPKTEVYGLTSQMRRAAVSVTSNIAEGYGRQSYKDKVNFFYQAQGSLIEVKNQLLVAKDVGFLPEKHYQELHQQCNQTHKLLQGLITKSKSFIKKR